MKRKTHSLMLELPRYVVPRARKGGKVAYFSVPKRLRPDGWPATYALGPMDDAKSFAAMIEKADRLNRELDAIRLGEDQGPKAGTIPHLIRLIEDDGAGLNRWAALSESSRATYRYAFKALLEWSASVGHPSAAMLTPQGVNALYVQYGDREKMRRLVAAALSKLLDVAVRHGLAPKNIMREMPSPPSKAAEANRENIWPEEYFETCLSAAVKRKEWSLARGLAFQRYHAQRPSDAILLHTDWLRDGRLEFRQKKTGALVRVPLDSAFKAILDQAPAQIGPLTLNGDKPHDDKSYRNALYRLQDELGLPRRAPKFLRHTGVLEMARAPLTALEISQRTGHSPANVTYILRHYLPQDDDMKQAASDKIETFRRNESRTRELNAVERKGLK